MFDADWSLRCACCHETFRFSALMSGCPSCASRSTMSVLEVHSKVPKSPPKLGSTRGGLGRLNHLLPGGDDFVSLGEGATPLVRSRRIAATLKMDSLWFKLEHVNPTGSFKDRYCAVSVNLARRFGFRSIVVSSTGNLGVAAAAYASAQGLNCLLIATHDVTRPMLGQALAHGAAVIITPREIRQAVFERIVKHTGWFPIGLMLPRAVQNPFGVEGYRAIAWETVEALAVAPDAVLFPCARGNGLYGAWKGFKDAVAWQWVQSYPRMFACQPIGANSIEMTLRHGADNAIELEPISSVARSASETVSDDRAVGAVRQSGGDGVSVSDEILLQATTDIAREGFCVEPSSALPVACLDELLRRGQLRRDWTVVCVLTATGSRWMDQDQLTHPRVASVDGVDGSIEQALAQLTGSSW